MKDSTFYLPITVLAPLAQLPLRARALLGHLLLAGVRLVSGGDCPSPCASGFSAPPAKGGSLERTGTGTAPPRPRCPWCVGSQQPPGVKTSPPVSPAGPALLSSCQAGITFPLAPGCCCGGDSTVLRLPAQAPLPAPFQQLWSSSYQCTQQSLGRRVGVAHCGPLSEQNHSHALVEQAGSL